MKKKLLPHLFWDYTRYPMFYDEEIMGGWEAERPTPSGLSVYEEGKFVCVEAALPGMNPEEVEVTLDKEVLWIKAEKKEEKKDKEKKFYHKAKSTFSYRVIIPGDIDESEEPEATFKNGIMLVKFKKIAKKQPKKIQIKKT